MNELVVVSGATKGIGKAVAERFARAGYNIAICARNGDELRQIKNDMEKKYKILVHIKQTDMSDRAQVKDFCYFVLAIQQPVAVLVNNAGYFLSGETMSEKEGALESLMESNVYSAYYLTRGLIDAMKRNKNGHIFNMCSIASIIAYPHGGSYTISKFALLGFSKVLREEMKPHGIRVTAVLPGATKTASWDGVDLPEDRFMKPEDVAEVIFNAYSISDRSVVEEVIIRPQLGDI
ncbi:MAG: SDR family oxidoreductase [Bacteroidetes bacterium]|nr:SDR family oxidoreductase [Bacteroidota bacterium]MBS1541165.1 SDR family oxidoreductase [Bacteroidota bacterium]